MKRKVEVRIYKDSGEFYSSLSLDTSKYDNIGFTKESLHDYVHNILLGDKKGFYFIATKDKITK